MCPPTWRANSRQVIPQWLDNLRVRHIKKHQQPLSWCVADIVSLLSLSSGAVKATFRRYTDTDQSARGLVGKFDPVFAEKQDGVAVVCWSFVSSWLYHRKILLSWIPFNEEREKGVLGFGGIQTPSEPYERKNSLCTISLASCSKKTWKLIAT